MKTSSYFVSASILLIVLFGLTIVSNAALINNGDGTITDTDRGIMWLQDANYAGTTGYVDALYDNPEYINGYRDYTNHSNYGRMFWDDAMQWADSLVFAGYNDWRLPISDTCVSWNCINSEMGHLFYTELGNEGWFDTEGNSTACTGTICLTNTGDFQNMQLNYISGTLHSPGYPRGINFSWGDQVVTGSTDDARFAMAVRVVPEPISSTLFIIGGATLGFRNYIKRRKKA